jgi:bifunctional non-homologous end joining protein LigD
MECLAVAKLPDGPQWLYEIKFRWISRRGRKVGRQSDPVFPAQVNRQFPLIVEALADLPDNTVIAGEVVALNDSGHPDFNLLQNFRSAASHIHYFVFDLLIHKGRDLTWLTPVERREIMRSALTFRSSRVRISDYVEASAADMLAAVRAQGLEGSSARKTASTSPASAAARG